MSTTSTQYDGGPAFPHNKELGDGSFSYHSGMSLRDWFAGQAIHAVEMRLGLYDPEEIAVRTYALADAMLAERAKGPTP